MKHQFHIAELISKYLSGTLDEKEQEELDAWRKSSASNEKLFEKLCDPENYKAYYKRSQEFTNNQGWEFLSKKMRNNQRRNIILKVCRYAAILLIPIIIAIIAIQDISYDNSVAEQLESQLVQILPGEKKAILTMDDGETIDLGDNTTKSMQEKDGTQILIDSTQLNYQLAENTQKTEKTIYNKIDVPRGGEYTLTLSDGTKVYLNAMSSLRFPVRFTDNTREVELEGEGYFEVTPNIKPFIVKYNNVAVEVLGTSFNISAYSDEESHTTLVNGSVKVSMGTGESTILKPSQQAYVKPGSNELNVRVVDTSQYTSWINGKIYFKDERLEDIMNQLSRWYDMSVFYAEPSIKDIRFGCNVNRYKEITPFLELLEQTEKLKISVKDKNITFKHNN